MADLPSDRAEPLPPFTYCGMDCFGPFHTKQGHKEQKRYGLLFTCLSSRAVHIEMLEDMTTDALINALQCFVAIRGTVRHIRLDQGTNFVGAKNEMAKALKELNKERVAAYLADNQCGFQMNTPHSSHSGGVWERQIRTVRSPCQQGWKAGQHFHYKGHSFISHAHRKQPSSHRSVILQVWSHSRQII